MSAPNARFVNDTTKDKYLVGTRFLYECKDGFININNGVPVIECNNSRQWTQPQLQCDLAMCAPFTIPHRTALNESIYRSGQHVSHYCLDGYNAVEPETTCHNGTWHPPPQCQDINECMSAGKCGTSVSEEDDLCVNLNGTFFCECGDGTYDEAGESCSSESFYNDFLTSKCLFIDLDECHTNEAGCSDRCSDKDPPTRFDCSCNDHNRWLFKKAYVQDYPSLKNASLYVGRTCFNARCTSPPVVEGGCVEL